MTEVMTREQPDGAGTGPLKRRGRRWRWSVRIAAAVGFVVGGLAIVGKVHLDRVEARAQRLASTGASLNSFLKLYVDGFKARDSRAILELHDEQYAGAVDGPWFEELQSERDGVAVQVALDLAGLPLCDLLQTPDELAQALLAVQPHTHSVKSPAAKTGQVQGRLTQRLGGQGPRVHGRTAHFGAALDERHALAEVRRLRGALFAARARAHHHELEGLDVHRAAL